MTLVGFALAVRGSVASTRHVNLNNPSPTHPYTDWETAATNIQDAIDAAVDGDLILVTNGVYQTGGRVVYGSLTNRVAIDKAVTVQSVNGPEFTFIKGYQVPGTTNGSSAVRCVYLDPGTALIGFTVTNGATSDNAVVSTEVEGGGVFVFYTGIVSNCVITGNSAIIGGGQSGGTMFNCRVIGNTGGGVLKSVVADCILSENIASAGGGAYASTLTNCVIKNNISASSGGGMYYGTARNCLIAGNSARFEGGGAFQGVLDNCTVIGNVASVGGGVHSSTIRNSILYHNTAVDGENHFGGTIAYSCITPLPLGGTNNFDAEPQLSSLSHLSQTSSCRQSGSPAFSVGSDTDHEMWANPPSVGCDEYYSGSVTGSLSASIRMAYTNVSTQFEMDFWAEINGRVSSSAWDFGDGTVISNRPYASHSWAMPGDYLVVLRAHNESYPGGILASSVVHVVQKPVHHVMANSTNPAPPYLSWATAASNIQDAVDVALLPGALVLVTNGFYDTGGCVVFGAMTNRVVVTNQITIQSVNGPETTVIVGHQVAGTTNGDGAVRCVYLSDRATIIGFTMTNGATRRSGDLEGEQSGGGVWCYNSAAIVSNCVIVGNSAYAYGGGSAFGSLLNCIVATNSAQIGGGSYRTVLTNCTITGNVAGDAGGAYWSTLGGCTLTYNSAASYGGAAGLSTLVGCMVTTNSAAVGGGARHSKLFGCRLIGNTARHYGGGADFCTVNNSLIIGNSAGADGGGTYNTDLGNSAVTGNSATRHGGGVYRGIQVNCTITGNSAGTAGGGVYDTLGLYNSIIYFNTAKTAANYFDGTLNYCCSTPLPASGSGNISADPALASTVHLSDESPCRNAALAFAADRDIDGEVWHVPPSIGCDERYAGLITGELAVAIHTVHEIVAKGFPAMFASQITGHAGASYWDFGDGTVVSNRPFATHSWAGTGEYAVVLRVFNDSNPTGITATQIVQVIEGVYYVSAANPNPQFPYTSWASAATNIQDAVDAASVAGASVLVSNGVYAAGGRSVGTNKLVNRVAVDKPIAVRSVFGLGFTFIRGFRVPGTTNGSTAVRCVYLASGASLSGFTLTNGATRTDGDVTFDRSGGGLFCEDASSTASDCAIVFNSAAANGGGVYFGMLTNCSLTANSAISGSGGAVFRTDLNNCMVTSNAAYSGGGAHLSTLNQCTLNGNRATFMAGGANMATLNRCVLMSNWAGNSGGGASRSALSHCVLSGNTTVFSGGGVNEGTLNSCLLLWNSASQGAGTYLCNLTNCTVAGNSATTAGGGASRGTQFNSILIANSSPTGSNYYTSIPSFCCTVPLPSGGLGNFTNAPLFMDLATGDLRLRADSSCINAGRNAHAPDSLDLDGKPRIVGGTVDVGAYEFQTPASVISYAWLEQYGLPLNGSADFTDPDGEGMNNWQEWQADTVPTNALSALRMLQPTRSASGVTLIWESANTRRYWLERAGNFAMQPVFSIIASNLPGQVNFTSYTDTNAMGGGPFFYRVGVQP